MTASPLDHEEMIISVELEHVPTHHAVTKTIFIHADDDQTVESAVSAVTQAAKDELLGLLENQGG